MPKTIVIGRTSWNERQEEDQLLMVESGLPLPSFNEPVADLVIRVRQLVGKVSFAARQGATHPAIAKLLASDSDRYESWQALAYPSRYNQPFFASPYEKRRLRIVDSMLNALMRCGMTVPAMTCKNPDGFPVRVGRSVVSLWVGQRNDERASWVAFSDIKRASTEPMSIGIRCNCSSLNEIQLEWNDGAGARVEDHLGEVAVNLIVAGELQARMAEQHWHAYQQRRRRALLDEKARQLAEAERRDEDRRRKVEALRVRKLIIEAALHRRAADIRSYVNQALAAEGACPQLQAEVMEWAAWAIDYANKIDPVRTRRFLSSLDDLDADAAQRS